MNMQIKCLHIKNSARIRKLHFLSGPVLAHWIYQPHFRKHQLCFLKYQRHSDGNRFVQVAATPDGVQGSVDSQRPAAFPGQLIEHLQKKKKSVLILYFMLLQSKQQQYKIYKTNHMVAV